jgi:hypothetical protein
MRGRAKFVIYSFEVATADNSGIQVTHTNLPLSPEAKPFYLCILNGYVFTYTLNKGTMHFLPHLSNRFAENRTVTLSQGSYLHA